MISHSDIVGFAGTALIIAAYFLLQTKRITSDEFRYSMMNLVGALCVLYSLVFKFNLPALVIELFWAGISLVGIFQWFRARRLRQSTLSNE